MLQEWGEQGALGEPGLLQELEILRELETLREPRELGMLLEPELWGTEDLGVLRCSGCLGRAKVLWGPC